MADVNETLSGKCRFLDETYFSRLYDAFIEAFSDYVFPFALTETQFRNHIVFNGVDLSRTIGCIDNGRLVGFSLNGFGNWNGVPTAYDAGTGVVPAYRRRGISEAMFEKMLPVFKADGIKQFLLEVVTSNEPAFRLYEKLGFKTVRTLALLQCDTSVTANQPSGDIEIREIVEPDWQLLAKLWDGQPSWQNSIDAVIRSRPVKRILGAFNGDGCVGYIVFSSFSGRIAQLAVDRDQRHHGVGAALVRAMQAETAEGFALQVINIDKDNKPAMEFFKDLGFYERLSQYEMVLPM
jgi:ribosomal protein S18 acetylase RimI-like enzyme